MVSDALKQLMHERKLREDEAFCDREARRLAEVKDAFFEGMLAGHDWLWHERPPGEYWLESETRRNLYAGPPKPEDPSKRAAMMIRATHGGRRPYNYDPQRDPGRVLGTSLSSGPRSKRPRRRK
jgi:hypothetical protein